MLAPLPMPSSLLLSAAAAMAAMAALLLASHIPTEASSCPFTSPASGSDHLHLQHQDHDHDHHHHHHDYHHPNPRHEVERRLPEELAEEEDLELEEFGHHHHSHVEEPDLEMSPLAIWVQAMGCSLLVSMASLICLIMLPLFFFQGKPSKTLVDALAVFGAGAMLGDAFLHQLPHAFGGEHAHAHDHGINYMHDHHGGHGHSHAHSLKDLSVGLSVLSGIVLFLLVEKVVRYVEDISGNGHGHHHHHHMCHQKVEDDYDASDKANMGNNEIMGNGALDVGSDINSLDDKLDYSLDGGKHTEPEPETQLRKRTPPSGGTDDKEMHLNAGKSPFMEKLAAKEKASSPAASSLVFGYLNLFSDGVHNFTDGMALGSAFLLYGSVGGWSRTLFLLAHELPQEVGDFGILVRSGFTVSKALLFNFLSALVALAGTALALILGKDPGQSSLIEGFTAGGFVYIAVAGVLPEMNTGTTTFKSAFIQLTSLTLGIAVALCISLVE